MHRKAEEGGRLGHPRRSADHPGRAHRILGSTSGARPVPPHPHALQRPQLIAQSGTYAELFTLQAAAYVDKHDGRRGDHPVASDGQAFAVTRDIGRSTLTST
jgi:hypothetical protein